MTMLTGMTGASWASGEVNGKEIRVEMISFNKKHLVVECRAPQRMMIYQHKIEKMVRQRIRRGFVQVWITGELLEEKSWRVDEKRLEAYHKEFTELGKRLGIEGRPSLDTLIGLPGVIVERHPGSIPEEAWEQISVIVEEALDGLIREKQREGEAAAKEVLSLADAIGALLEQVGELLPELTDRRIEKYRAKLEAAAGTALDEKDVLREIAVMVNKHDVAEEVHRLSMHLAEVYSLVRSTEAVGMRLQFVAQEMCRESTTLCNKSDEPDLTRLAMEIRARSNAIREIAANVE